MTAAAWRNALAALALVAAGCASTPQASPERDAQAKKFETDPRSATLYVYRLDLRDADDDGGDSVLYVDQKLIGSTVAGSYFVMRLRTGVHTFSGVANDQGKLKLEVRAGGLYFVWLKVRGGESFFEPVSVEKGKRDILASCVLFENWEPGQRPLLR
jgi:hypothetical protein